MDNLTREQHDDRLQDLATKLITEASVLQQKISTAKTATKRNFYGKKMDVVRKEIQQVLSIKELLKMTGDKDDTTPTV